MQMQKNDKLALNLVGFYLRKTQCYILMDFWQLSDIEEFERKKQAHDNDGSNRPVIISVPLSGNYDKLSTELIETLGRPDGGMATHGWDPIGEGAIYCADVWYTINREQEVLDAVRKLIEKYPIKQEQ